ncbi:MAG: response regulator [Magnetococcus sp. YQC-5]
MKTLIVDDEFINREVMKKILEPYGTCDLAENGQEAVQRFKQALHAHEPYDLVLLDMRMPVMNGLDALHQIRQAENTMVSGGILTKSHKAFVIIVTIVDNPSEFKKAYFEGQCNGFINKPVDPDLLLERLRKHKLI